MRKIFTKPSECVYPTCDNAEGNLVVGKGDYIVKSDDLKYMVIDILGTGTFGQVFRCISDTGDEIAIKVVKSANKYYQCEMNEVRILKRLKDLQLNEYFSELHDAFIYKQHLCLVIELLGKNMYEIIKIFKFKGMDFSSVRIILRQVLEGLSHLHSIGVIHGDLKPENILINDIFKLSVKIIDFGSSSTKAVASSFYVQSRFYRAPEVILGIPYSCAIDMWSFGCIAYEILMGHPLFPGCDNKDQIYRIHEFFKDGIPSFMFEHGSHSHEYFDKSNKFFGRDNQNKVKASDIIAGIYSKYGKNQETDLFIDMFMKSINPSYLERAMPYNLMKHPFFSYDSINSFTYDDDERHSGTKIPLQNDKPRKMSMFNLLPPEHDNDYFNTRKGSVFDHNIENRNNKK